MTIEKRRHLRINSLNLSYVCIDDNEEIVHEGMGRTLNVSESGILLETHFPIEPTQSLSLTLALEEDLVDIRGNVVHCTSRKEDKFETGVEFSDVDDNMSRVLKKFIALFREQSGEE